MSVTNAIKLGIGQETAQGCPTFLHLMEAAAVSPEDMEAYQGSKLVAFENQLNRSLFLYKMICMCVTNIIVNLCMLLFLKLGLLSFSCIA